MSANSGSLPKSHTRIHSHSVSSGSLFPNHRVSRRKSVTSNAGNVAAMVAAVREAGDTTIGMPITGRRNTMSKGASARSAALGSLPSPPASLQGQKIRYIVDKVDRGESAIEDDQNDDMDDEENDFNEDRNRRASEGQQSMKDGKKASDLKCDKCGKGYKHSSCLSKHLFVPTFLSYMLPLASVPRMLPV